MTTASCTCGHPATVHEQRQQHCISCCLRMAPTCKHPFTEREEGTS